MMQDWAKKTVDRLAGLYRGLPFAGRQSRPEAASEDDRSAKESSRRLRRRFLTIGKFALLAGILIAVGLFSAVVGMKIAVRRTEVAAPDVVGKTYQEARSLLEGTRLEAAILARRYDPDAAADTVVSQSPGPGGLLKQGNKVRLVLSLGARKQPVPQLVGSDLRVARARVMQTDYVLGHVSEVISSAAEDGTVIRQYPPPGTEERGGFQIDLLVARRMPKRYIMPDIVGQSLNRVFQLFEPEGIGIGQIRYRSDRYQRRGTVLRQYPEPGYMLKETDQINVEVAG